MQTLAVKAEAAPTRSRLQERRWEDCFPASPSLAAPREGSAASTSNLRQGKSDPALTVAVLP